MSSPKDFFELAKKNKAEILNGASPAAAPELAAA